MWYGTAVSIPGGGNVAVDRVTVYVPEPRV